MTQTILANRLINLILLLLVPLGFGFYSIYLGQDTNWDLMNYHLYNPYAYINDRLSLDLAPAGIQTYFNPFLDDQLERRRELMDAWSKHTEAQW